MDGNLIKNICSGGDKIQMRANNVNEIFSIFSILAYSYILIGFKLSKEEEEEEELDQFQPVHDTPKIDNKGPDIAAEEQVQASVFLYCPPLDFDNSICHLGGNTAAMLCVLSASSIRQRLDSQIASVPIIVHIKCRRRFQV